MRRVFIAIVILLFLAACTSHTYVLRDQIQPYYLDAMVGGLSLASGVFAPSLVNWNGTSAQELCFAGTVRNEYASGTFEIPHSWQEGSMVSPHINVGKSTTAAGNYTFNIDGFFMNGTGGNTIRYNKNITITNGNIWQFVIADLDDVNLTGFTLATTFNFRITRLQDDPKDNYPDCVAVEQVSIHYLSDSHGSIAEYSKWG